MKRKISVFVALTGVIVLAVGAVAGAIGAWKPIKTKDYSVEFTYVKEGKTYTTYDVPPSGPSKGDGGVFDDQIIDNDSSTKHSGVCVQVGSNTAILQCTVTSQLPGGSTVTAQGILNTNDFYGAKKPA